METIINKKLFLIALVLLAIIFLPNASNKLIAMEQKKSTLEETFQDLAKTIEENRFLLEKRKSSLQTKEEIIKTLESFLTKKDEKKILELRVLLVEDEDKEFRDKIKKVLNGKNLSPESLNSLKEKIKKSKKIIEKKEKIIKEGEKKKLIFEEALKLFRQAKLLYSQENRDEEEIQSILKKIHKMCAKYT